MRKVIALVFHYSLNGLLADEGTEYYRFCFDLLDQHGGPDDDDQTLDFLQGAHAHVMGRQAYEGMSANLPANPDHPWADILTARIRPIWFVIRPLQCPAQGARSFNPDGARPTVRGRHARAPSGNDRRGTITVAPHRFAP